MLTVSINLSYVIKLQSKQCSLVYWPAVHLWLTTNCKESANRQLIVFQQISTGSFGVFSCFLSFLEVHKVAIFFIVETSFKAWIFTLLSTIFFFLQLYITQDDPASMDFVTSAANIRAHIFSIPIKSRFDVKGLWIIASTAEYAGLTARHFIQRVAEHRTV